MHHGSLKLNAYEQKSRIQRIRQDLSDNAKLPRFPANESLPSRHDEAPLRLLHLNNSASSNLAQGYHASQGELNPSAHDHLSGAT